MSEEAKPAPVPGTPEYEAAMIAKFDSHQVGANADPAAKTDEPTKPQKPEGVPDKFWSAEKGVVDYAAWSKSTSEAEKRLTELSTAAKATDEAKKAEADKAHAAAMQKHGADKGVLEKKVADLKASNAKAEDIAAAEKELSDHNAKAPQAPAQKAAEQVLESKGLDMAEFSKEFSEKGKLSDESYTKLEKAGLTKDIVDGYIAGQQALASKRDNALIEKIGGAKSWEEMSRWGGQSLSQAEQDAFNNALTGSLEEATQAMLGLKQRYEAANGKAPDLLGGGPAAGEGGYTSMEPYKADLRNPLYQTDEAFRNKVIAKLEKTTAF